MGQVIQIDEARIRGHLGEMVGGTVEEALNAMLGAEADRLWLCGAGRYERSEGRQETRAGHHERNLETRAGKVGLRVPKLRRQTFETAIIQRYRRRESAVEEALIEMYLAGISVRRVEDITEALWGRHREPHWSERRSRPSEPRYGVKPQQSDPRQDRGMAAPTHRRQTSVCLLDGIVIKHIWAGDVRNASLPVAIGVSSDGYREILGLCDGAKEDKAVWSAFLRQLLDRGLKGVEPIDSDACRGLVKSGAECLQDVS